MIISRQGNITSPTILLGGEQVTPVKSAKNLGVIFESNLSMEKQVNATRRSCSYELRCIGKIRKYLDDEGTARLVNAFVTSKLDYCNSLYFKSGSKCIEKLQHIQNSAARLIKRIPRHERRSITRVRKELHWLPIEQRIKFKILVLTFKALQNNAPDYICKLLKPYVPSPGDQSREHRSEKKNLLDERNARLKTVGDRAFEISAPHLWNHMPDHLRLIEKEELFRRELKTVLFLEAYNCL